MAVNQSRSMNAELAEGMSDGKYKKANTDRGGASSTGTLDTRRDLHPDTYDIVESPVKVLPDGTAHVKTPDYVHMRPQPGLLPY